MNKSISTLHVIAEAITERHNKGLITASEFVAPCGTKKPVTFEYVQSAIVFALEQGEYRGLTSGLGLLYSDDTLTVISEYDCRFHVNRVIKDLGYEPALNQLFGLSKSVNATVFYPTGSIEVLSLEEAISLYPNLSVDRFIRGVEKLLDANCYDTAVRFSVVLKDKLEINISSGDASHRFPVSKQLIVDIKNGSFRKRVESRYGSFKSLDRNSLYKSEKGNLVTNAKNVMQGLRLKKLLGQIKETNTPQEAFTLLTHYLDKYTEIGGTIAREDMKTTYRFLYHPEEREVSVQLSVISRDKETNEMKAEVLGLSCTVNDKTIAMVYNSFLGLGELLK